LHESSPLALKEDKKFLRKMYFVLFEKRGKKHREEKKKEVLKELL
jgi:hypothetical protein